jgi:hypothetical protein
MGSHALFLIIVYSAVYYQCLYKIIILNLLNLLRNVYVYIYVSFKVLVCIVVSWIVCMAIAVLCILWSTYVYLLYCVSCCTGYLLYCVLCICCTVGTDVFPLYAGLLTRGQYSEGPATGHLDTGFSRFPRVFKKMLRLFPTLQVATTCFSCSPPENN